MKFIRALHQCKRIFFFLMSSNVAVHTLKMNTMLTMPSEVMTKEVIEKIHSTIMEDCQMRVCKAANTVGISSECTHNVLLAKMHIRNLYVIGAMMLDC